MGARGSDTMKCPRCGEEYDKYNVELSIFEGCTAHFWCDKCNTTLEVPMQQGWLNKVWLDKDQGPLHEKAKSHR